MSANEPPRALPGSAIPDIAPESPGDAAGTASTPERKQAWDIFGSKLEARRLSGWSVSEIADQAEKEIPGGTTAVERRLLRETLEGRPAPRRTPEPIATKAQAHDAYRRLNSERGAAAELGISRTQLRRLLGRIT